MRKIIHFADVFVMSHKLLSQALRRCESSAPLIDVRGWIVYFKVEVRMQKQKAIPKQTLKDYISC